MPTHPDTLGIISKSGSYLSSCPSERFGRALPMHVAHQVYSYFKNNTADVVLATFAPPYGYYDDHELIVVVEVGGEVIHYPLTTHFKIYVIPLSNFLTSSYVIKELQSTRTTSVREWCVASCTPHSTVTVTNNLMDSYFARGPDRFDIGSTGSIGASEALTFVPFLFYKNTEIEYSEEAYLEDVVYEAKNSLCVPFALETLAWTTSWANVAKEGERQT